MSPSLPRPTSLLSALGAIVGCAWGALFLQWLLDVGGVGGSSGWQRGTALLALVSLVAFLVAGAVKMWRGEGAPGGSASARWLLALIVLSLVVRVVGIDYEVGRGYYRDEGIYRAAAEEINEGELLPESFIYGHLPYYMAAFTLWTEGHFPEASTRLVSSLFDAERRIEVTWIWIRFLAAWVGALTTIPIFVAAGRIAGTAAGVIAGVLICFSPIYNEVAHVFISDVPAAFFAALTLLFVARLLDGENLPDYLLAGVCAGLAAGCKYPAGLVAVAIVGIWVAWRIKSRSFSWHLVWAGAASLATFLAVMPALPLYAGAAFANEGKDLFFGVRQYAKGGWIGVQPESLPLWYGGRMAESFGWPAVVLGLAGIVVLTARQRRRLAAMSVFPVVYLLLLFSMSMVVKRNLQPVLPAVAMVLGVGVAAWPMRFAPARARRLAVVATGLAALVLPIFWTVAQDVRLTRSSTREVATEWLAQNLAPGTLLVKESYTPNPDKRRFSWHQRRYAVRGPMEEILHPDFDYLMLAAPAYGRFLDPGNWSEPHHEEYARRYGVLFDLPVVQEFEPGPFRDGPHLTLYRIDPDPIEWQTERSFTTNDRYFLNRRESKPKKKGRSICFPKHLQFVTFRDYFRAGTYTVAVQGNVTGPVGLTVAARPNRGIAEKELPGGKGSFVLPEDEKLLISVRLGEGDCLKALTVERVEG